MKYTNEQIKEKYKENAFEILNQLQGINKELTKDELVIDFNGKDEISVNNSMQVSKAFQGDFLVIYDSFCDKQTIDYFNLDLIDLGKDKDTYVEFITLEDKIFRISLIPIRIIHTNAMLTINTDAKNKDDFFACLPSLFFYNTKTRVLGSTFLANKMRDIKNDDLTKQKLISFDTCLRKLPEIRPNLKVVNGGIACT